MPWAASAPAEVTATVPGCAARPGAPCRAVQPRNSSSILSSTSPPTGSRCAPARRRVAETDDL